MKRRLSVKDDPVTVVQMPLNSVPNRNMLISTVLEHLEIDVLSVVSFDVLRAWMFCRPGANELAQVLLVVLRDDFRNCQVHRDLLGYT